MQDKSKIAYKTIKLIILTDKKEENILEKMARKHTYTVKRFLEIIKKENLTSKIKSNLHRLTITSRNRPIVPYDLKKETKLSHRYLAQCMNYAICLYSAYLTKSKKWEQLITKQSKNKIEKIIQEIEVDSTGNLISIKDDISEILDNLLNDGLIKKILNSSHSFPCESQNHKPKKIPVYFDNQILELEKTADSFKLHLSTHKLRERIILDLNTNEYHFREISNYPVVGGFLYKNIAKKRWEFHATVKVNTPEYSGKKKAIFGVDIGMVTDATVVVLLENNSLKQKQIHFLKVPELKKKKFFLMQRKSVLQKKIANAPPIQKIPLVQELKNVYNKITKNSKAVCHKISKMIADIAQNYLTLGYEVHIAIGQLSGIRTRAMKGNYKGKKYRGKIHSFPFYQMTENIKYKCRIIGVDDKNISTISESWTSKTCHKCDSVNTIRLSQASFKCLNCNCEYHADVNGAINIALRYIKNQFINDSNSIKMIYLFPNKKSAGLSNPYVTLLNPQGNSSSPPCNESTGADYSAHIKVEDARKVQTLQ
ncbi:MAG TPA: transposase [Candidatus Bathyarchaeia archaeon]|nr:transposase [Candidatus Bathyarchaeia archaeon]